MSFRTQPHTANPHLHDPRPGGPYPQQRVAWRRAWLQRTGHSAAPGEPGGPSYEEMWDSVAKEVESCKDLARVMEYVKEERERGPVEELVAEERRKRRERWVPGGAFGGSGFPPAGATGRVDGSGRTGFDGGMGGGTSFGGGMGDGTSFAGG